MRLRLFLAATLAATACSGGGGSFVDGGPDTPTLDSATPNFGPMHGGTRVTLHGSGFLRGDAPPDRVLFNGVEAPLAGAIDDGDLEVDIPASDTPGDAQIVVFNQNGYVTATGIFHYSDPPTVTSATPGKLRFDQGGTVTVTGTGFQDENAGVVQVLVDGAAALDVSVTSDTSLSFTAPPGAVMTKPDVEVVDERGNGTKVDAYEYGPGPQGGVLCFVKGDNANYAAYYDIAGATTSLVPRILRGGGGGGGFSRYHASYADAAGNYFAVERNTDSFMQINPDSQTELSPIPLNGVVLKSFARVGTTIYTINRSGNLFGTFDPATAAFTPITSTALPTPSGHGTLVADAAGNMFYLNGNQIVTINRATGALGTPVPLSVISRWCAATFAGGVLYAVNNGNAIYTINPTTGVVTHLANLNATCASADFIQ